jgi:hypothetical protein
MPPWGRRVILIGIGGLLAIQVVAVEQELPAAPSVPAVLRRACDACRSHETAWPWYSGVAPVSWLIAWDVHEGRATRNFSTWNRDTP